MPSVFYYQPTDSRKASAQRFFLKHISTGFLKTPIQITRPIHPTRKRFSLIKPGRPFFPLSSLRIGGSLRMEKGGSEVVSKGTVKGF